MALETYHNKTEGSDYLYNAIKTCINEVGYIRKNLRRHGEEYSLDYLIEYYKKTDGKFTEASDALIEEIIDIKKRRRFIIPKSLQIVVFKLSWGYSNFNKGIQKTVGVFKNSLDIF